MPCRLLFDSGQLKEVGRKSAIQRRWFHSIYYLFSDSPELVAVLCRTNDPLHAREGRGIYPE